jgi:hypothetical protein
MESLRNTWVWVPNLFKTTNQEINSTINVETLFQVCRYHTLPQRKCESRDYCQILSLYCHIDWELVGNW